MASTITDPDGNYHVLGLEPGQYSAYAEPLDGPVNVSHIPTLEVNYPGKAVADGFATRYAVQSTSNPALTLTKTGGDVQTGNMGEALAEALEVQVNNTSGTPVSGVTVDFSGASGGGTALPHVAITDSQGRAQTTAYLGTGLTQTFIAYAGSARSAFTAMVRAPVLASITSNSGAPGATVNVTLTGLNFARGGTTVSVNHPGVTTSSVNVRTTTSLTAVLTINANATPGSGTVTVATVAGTSNGVTFNVVTN